VRITIHCVLGPHPLPTPRACSRGDAPGIGLDVVGPPTYLEQGARTLWFLRLG